MPTRLMCLPVLLTVLAGCDSEAWPPAGAPPPPPPVPYVQNVYAYGPTHVYPSQPTFTIAAPPAPTTQVLVPSPPPPPDAFVPSASLPETFIEPPPPRPPLSPRAEPVSTGIPACDAYLARVEACSRRMIPETLEGDSAYRRVIDTLDLARRNWLRAARTDLGRESLVDSCETAKRVYEASVRRTCRL